MTAPPAFASFVKRALFDDLRDRADRGARCPSLAAIRQAHKLDSDEAAANLLSALERDGVIDILRIGECPWISVIRNTYTGLKVSGVSLDPERFDRQEPSAPVELRLATPVGQIAERMTRIAAETTARAEPPAPTAPEVEPESPPEPAPLTIEEVEAFCRANNLGPATFGQLAVNDPNFVGQRLKGGRRFKAKTVLRVRAFMAEFRMPERPAVETGDADMEVESAAESRATASIAQGPEPATLPAQAAEEKPCSARADPQAVKARHALEPARQDRRQVNLHLPIGDHDLLAALAAQRGVSVGALARELLLGALARPDLQPDGKHLIRAEVTRAWRGDGRKFGDFVTALIDLGLESYLAFREAA